MHGPQDDVFGDQVERGHLLLGGERRQQMAVHRVNVNRVLALWGKTDFRMCWTPVVAKIMRAPACQIRTYRPLSGNDVIFKKNNSTEPSWRKRVPSIVLPFYESVPPVRSAPQCGPPCPPAAPRSGPGQNFPRGAAATSGTALV